MTHPDHPFLSTFLAHATGRSSCAELTDTLAEFGIVKVSDDPRLRTYEAAVVVAHSLEQSLMEDHDGADIRFDLSSARVLAEHQELEADNYLTGDVGGAIQDDWDNWTLFRNPETQNLMAIIAEDRAWRGFLFASQPPAGLDDFLSQPHKATAERMRSTVFDTLALHEGPVEKPEFRIALNEAIPAIPAPQSTSMDYIHFHSATDPELAHVFSDLTFYAEVDRYFGRVRRTSK